jgi:hypothetical protein
MKIDLKCACGATAVFETQHAVSPKDRERIDKALIEQAEKFVDGHKNHATMFGADRAKAGA